MPIFWLLNFSHTSSSSWPCYQSRATLDAAAVAKLAWHNLTLSLFDKDSWISRSSWKIDCFRKTVMLYAIISRDGRIRVGDEIINVCGKRLRGLSIEDAIKALKQPKRELDIVVARDCANGLPVEEFTSFFDEDRLRDEHRRIAQKINGYNDFHETCSEVNLSSRPTNKNGTTCFSKCLTKKNPTFLRFSAAYVSRTYIGSSSQSQSSLAMKIHRKSQLSLLPSSGSLSSLHETALTSDVEDVRSSVSAYQPVSHSKRTNKR